MYSYSDRAIISNSLTFSVSYTTDDLLFDWEETMPLAVDENIELPQLDLVKTERGDCTQVYSTGNFTCLQVIFTLKRRLGYYLFHTYIPTCLIVIMSWVSFWIKPEAVPARVTLGVTSLLTLSTQHAKSQASLPPVSYIKAIDIFMSSCTFFVFLSLMEYALVNVVLEDEQATFRQMNNETQKGCQAHGTMDSVCQVSTVQSHGVSVMIWGVSSYQFLVLVPTSLNAIQYIELLGDHLHQLMLYSPPHGNVLF
ncbi:glycine receptor subunit alpha-3 [Trichonephila clavipes]|nr:glycine receptor subunit alpha-3 [Trichonephila clavipes]